jgi:hypothetical protein
MDNMTVQNGKSDRDIRMPRTWRDISRLFTALAQPLGGERQGRSASVNNGNIKLGQAKSNQIKPVSLDLRRMQGDFIDNASRMCVDFTRAFYCPKVPNK